MNRKLSVVKEVWTVAKNLCALQVLFFRILRRSVWPKSERQHKQIQYLGMSSRYRPGVAQSVPGGLDSQIFMTFGT
jgi:hypothetical protein